MKQIITVTKLNCYRFGWDEAKTLLELDIPFQSERAICVQRGEQPFKAYMCRKLVKYLNEHSSEYEYRMI